VHEDERDGSFVATALGNAIATQGETVEELLAKLEL
jgi:predicted RNase H-like HicB family nuclease